MKLFFLHHPVNHMKDKAGDHALTVLQETQHNITEGGEFLDDALRMKEQPLMYERTATNMHKKIHPNQKSKKN